MKKLIMKILVIFVINLFTNSIFADDAIDHFQKGKNIIESNCADCGPTKEGIENGIQELKKAIELNPNLGEAYIYLGEGYYNYSFFGGITNRPEVLKIRFQAYESFKKAVEMLPNNAMAHQWLSLIYSYGGEGLMDHGKSLIEIEKAIKIDPGNNKYKYDLAEIYYRLNRYSDALELYQKLGYFDNNKGKELYNELINKIKEQGGKISPPEEKQKGKEEAKKPEVVAPAAVFGTSSEVPEKPSEQKQPLPIAPTKEAEKDESRIILYVGVGILAVILIGIGIFLIKRKSKKQ